jgi:Protein of unknown function (DUF4242)
MAHLPCAHKTPRTHLEHEKEESMEKYVIERDIPGVGGNTPEGFCKAARQSNQVLGQLEGIQWMESFVTPDKLFCVYLADNEQVIRDHAQKSGFPATRIHKVKTVLDPTSANA